MGKEPNNKYEIIIALIIASSFEIFPNLVGIMWLYQFAQELFRLLYNKLLF